MDTYRYKEEPRIYFNNFNRVPEENIFSEAKERMERAGCRLQDQAGPAADIVSLCRYLYKGTELSLLLSDDDTVVYCENIDILNEIEGILRKSA